MEGHMIFIRQRCVVALLCSAVRFPAALCNLIPLHHHTALCYKWLTHASAYSIHMASFKLGSFLIGFVSSWAQVRLNSFLMSCLIRNDKR